MAAHDVRAFVASFNLLAEVALRLIENNVDVSDLRSFTPPLSRNPSSPAPTPGAVGTRWLLSK